MTMNDLDKRIREYMKWLDEHYYEAFNSKEAYANYEYDDGRCDAYEVVPEKLRTLDHGRPWSDDQFASTRLSSNRDMSR